MSNKNTPRSRLLYIDNLRIVLMILVIMHHFAIGYGAPGGFYYREIGPMSDISGIFLTLLVAINQAFFMGFFFMISSYFSPGSVDKKGARTYLLDRAKRLGIPLLLYVIIIDPLLIFITTRASGDVQSIWQSLSQHYSNIHNFSSGQLWFVAALLIFSLVYVAWRSVNMPIRSVGLPISITRAPALSNTNIAFFALALGVVTFIVRIWMPVGTVINPVLGFQIAHFPQYIALFVIGIIAYRRHWFKAITDAQGRFWFRIVLVLIALFPVLFVAAGALEGDVDAAMGGFHWESLAYSVWEQFMCMAMITALLVWFRRRFNRQGILAKTMSKATYATYVFHAPTIIVLAIMLKNLQVPDMGLKYLLVLPLALTASFLVGTITRQVPVARGIL